MSIELIREQYRLEILFAMEQKANMFFKLKEKEPTLTEEKLYHSNPIFRKLCDKQYNTEQSYMNFYKNTYLKH